MSVVMSAISIYFQQCVQQIEVFFLFHLITFAQFMAENIFFMFYKIHVIYTYTIIEILSEIILPYGIHCFALH